MVGAFADESWKPVTVVLQPGDILLFYSDGVFDAAALAAEWLGVPEPAARDADGPTGSQSTKR
jgi:serine phosphatase RsbU (regulator of sigma subunit)